MLREEGYEVVLVNSNPATIMTDPEFADAHLHRAARLRARSTRIIESERPRRAAAHARRPDGAQPGDGAQRGGVARALGVELIGADCEAIASAEDRELFRDAMDGRAAGAAQRHRRPRWPRSRRRRSRLAAAIVRPAFTLGGTGGGIAHDRDEHCADRRATACG